MRSRRTHTYQVGGEHFKAAGVFTVTGKILHVPTYLSLNYPLINAGNLIANFKKCLLVPTHLEEGGPCGGEGCVCACINIVCNGRRSLPTHVAASDVLAFENNLLGISPWLRAWLRTMAEFFVQFL